MNIYERALKHAVEQTVHEDMFPVVWCLIKEYPDALALADLLVLHDGLDQAQEQAVIDAALEANMLDMLTRDFQRKITHVSAQLAVFGLEIVEVEQVGYKVCCKEDGK